MTFSFLIQIVLGAALPRTAPLTLKTSNACNLSVSYPYYPQNFRSDLEQPLPRWRRRLVEVSSSGFNQLMLFSAGFWMPRVTGLEHWEEGKRVGAVGASCACTP